MSQQIIDLGTGPDSQTGDDLYTAFTKVNDNFTELYGVFDGNGITTINANAIISNNIWNSGNVRTNEVFAYGNVETVGYVITAGAFYPNGIPIGSFGSIDSSIVPLANGIYNLGSETYTFSNLYLSNSVVISGANVAVENDLLFINDLPVGNYSNVNVANYLPIYDGNTAAILTTTSQPYITQLGTLTNLDALTANINGNLLVYGNLTVEGNITYFNIRDLSVVDPIITLNTGPNGAPLVANNGFDSGIISYYYDTQNKSAFFGRIDSTGYFEYYSNVVSEVGNIVSGTYGTIKTGNLLLTEDATITGNVDANYFLGNGRNLSGINSVSDGNSNLFVYTDGSITISSGDVSNVAIFTNTTTNLSGNLNVTGSIYATEYFGNVSGNITAPGSDTQIIFNDGGLLSASAGLVFDKTSNSVSVTGNLSTESNILVNGLTVVDNTGNVLTARLEDSGVVVGTYGNSSAVPIITIDSKGRITDINVTPVAGVSNVSYEIGDSNLSIFTSAGTVFSVNLGVGTNNSPTFAGTTVTGNLFAEFANANTVVTDGTAYLYNISSTGTANLTTLNVLGNADVTGNVDANNVNVSDVITANIVLGNISGTTGSFTGNISADTLNGNISGYTGVFTGNISADTLNGNINGDTGTFTGNISADTLNGNISGTTGIFNGNISADTLTGNISGTTGTFTGNISADTLNGNISGDTGVFTGNIISDKLFAATIGNTGTLLTGTLTTTNQPNITSVGSSLTIGEFNLSNNTISSTSDTITIEPANVGSTGNVIIQGNLRVTGNLTYIDSTVFTVNDKDILLANNTANISDLNGAGLLIGNASGVNLVTLKYSTSLNSWQTNVGFSPVGNAIIDLGTTSTYWANAYIDSLYSTSLTGTLHTAAQPNITSVGTLNGLTLDNTLIGTTINALTIGNTGSTLQGSSLSVSDSITGNTLQINSSANIDSTLTVIGNVTAPYFIGNVVGNVLGNLSAPGSDTQILFNDNNIVGANSGLTYNKTTGTLTVLGNISASVLNGNISGTTGVFTGNISADTLNGNISGTTGVFTGNISADTLNGNISGTTGVFTGNISADTLNGNISGTTGTFTGNISADTLNGNISGTTGTFTGNISADTLNGNISGTTGTFTGNISADTLNGNISGTTGTFTGNISADTLSGNISGTTGTFTGNISADTLSGNISGTTGTFTGNISADTLNGNISGTTGVFTGNISADTLNGNISGTTGVFTGNISADTLNGNISGTTGTFTGNISADTLNGNISGTTGVFTGNISADTLNGNISGTTGTFTGNISADTLNGNISGTTGTFTGNLITNSLFGATIGNVGTLLTGTLTTANQPNITSVSNSLTIGEFNLSNNTISSTNDTITIEPANVGSSGNVIIQGNLRVTGNLTYIDSTVFTVNDKDILLGNNTSNIGDLNGAGLLIGNASGVNLVTLKYSTSLDSWQTNVGFSPVGNASIDLGTTSTYWSNAYIDIVNSTTLVGTLQTAAQPNITSVGTLTSLSLSGNLVGTNLQGTTLSVSESITSNTLVVNSAANIGSTLSVVGNVTAPYFIGNIIGNITGNIDAPGSDTQILFNDGNLIGANSGLTFNKVTGTLTVIGNISADTLTGNISGTTGTFTGNISADTLNGNISGTTGVFTGNISADTLNGNISGTTGVFTGNISADTLNGNISGTTGVFTGNISADTLNGNISGTTGVFTGNISADTLNGNISGTTGVFTGNISADTLNGNISGTTGTFTGNISADTLTGNISGTTGTFTGNISADTLNGNISGTTGVFTGNISADTLNGNISGTTGTFTGNISADTLNGNISGTTGTFTGNISANNISSINEIQSTTLVITANATVGNLSTAGLISTTNTTDSTSNITGAVVVTGGIGVGKNLYVGNAVGWVYPNAVSAVYQVYNSVTNSLDTIFG